MKNLPTNCSISLISDILREDLSTFILLTCTKYCVGWTTMLNWTHVRISLTTVKNLYIVGRDMWHNNTK